MDILSNNLKALEQSNPMIIRYNKNDYIVKNISGPAKVVNSDPLVYEPVKMFGYVCNLSEVEDSVSITRQLPIYMEIDPSEFILHFIIDGEDEDMIYPESVIGMEKDYVNIFKEDCRDFDSERAFVVYDGKLYKDNKHCKIFKKLNIDIDSEEPVITGEIHGDIYAIHDYNSIKEVRNLIKIVDELIAKNVLPSRVFICSHDKTNIVKVIDRTKIMDKGE